MLLLPTSNGIVASPCHDRDGSAMERFLGGAKERLNQLKKDMAYFLGGTLECIVLSVTLRINALGRIAWCASDRVSQSFAQLAALPGSVSIQGWPHRDPCHITAFL